MISNKPLSELILFKTKDGSLSLRSALYKENFHSNIGAFEETKLKFTNPSNLKKFKNKSINVLDICFGLGYNSASLFTEIIKQNSFINWYALEIDKTPLQYSLRSKSFNELWDPKVKKIFKSLHQSDKFIDSNFNCNILWGDARKKIIAIPSEINFDLIYLDGFSPQKCPMLWSVEFLSKVRNKLSSQGSLITYSSSAALRNTLRGLGLEIFNIKPELFSEKKWSNGTVAIKDFNNFQVSENSFLEKLSIREEEHLLTKASIPYRDPNLISTKKEILQTRVKEQLFSKLCNTKNWRKKWGMTK